ncbi:MAG: biotin-dependent carboxyltransferase family protein [Candidatus Limnocylindrales bacterium]
MRPQPAAADAVLEVIDPGLLTSVQDLGRPDRGPEGITRGGAADTWSLAVANALVGNDAGAAALECTLLGPVVRALRAVTVGIGGTMAAHVVETGMLVRPGASVILEEGWTLALESPGTGGARGYLAVPGGIAVPVILGSRSTALGAGFGGFGGRALRAGDRLTVAAPPDRRTPPAARWPGEPAVGPGPVRILPGPDAIELPEDALADQPLVDGALADGALARLIAGPWLVNHASDRVGLRLDGPTLPRRLSGERASHGVVAGTIQLPPDGRPIVLLVDHQPTGGYPVLGVVIQADLPVLAQLAPGASVDLRLVTPGDARQALAERSLAFDAGVSALREAARWDDLWQGAGG